MTEFSDQRLARRAARGDRRAFEQIYRRYHQELYRFCLAMLGSPQDAQDTLQNTMVKVLRALPGEKREIKLKPWLYRIARNEAVETLRRRRDRLEPMPEQAAPAAAQIAERVEDRERLRRLLADLGELPDRQRGALVMRELSGLSFAEIGRAFETSPATARQTVYEARLSLGQMEAGREMDCGAVTKALSDADGRVTRRRGLRAHLRDCAACRAFADGIDERRGELAAIGPLPLAASAGLLHGVLSGQASGALAGGATSAGGLGGSLGGGAGKAIATSALAKSAAAVTIVAVVGVSVAGRAGLIDGSNRDLGGGKASRAAASEPAGGTQAAKGGNGPVAGRPGADSRSSPARAGNVAGSRRAAGEAQGSPSLLTPAGEPPHQASSGQASESGDHGDGQGHGGAGQKHSGPHSRLPAAAARGQATAAAHKSPHANSSPGAGPRSAPKPTQPSQSSPKPGSGHPHPESSSTSAGAPEPPTTTENGPDGKGRGPLQR
jgi:RNA polymerase sigma factor (sigma-70 family)